MRSGEIIDRIPVSAGPELRIRDSFYLFLLGCAIFLIFGAYWASLSANSMTDFRPPYASARCLIRHCDPYNPAQVLRIYLKEGGARSTDTRDGLLQVMYGEYPPSTLTFLLFFALFPAGVAQVLWGVCIAACFVFASLLMWREAAGVAPALAGCLLCFLTANSGLLLGVGNPSGIAVSLCVIGAWCFLRERFALAGILCLAASLSLKPHDAGLIWLYFLLAGRSYRKRALQTLAVTLAVNLPVSLWVARLSPHWIEEISHNIQVLMTHGGMNDPGPASTGVHGIDMMINLQAVFAFYRDNPHFYNLATYCVCVPLLLLWLLVTIRSRPTGTTAWFGLAVIAALSMLPLYHRQYDARLILLTVPACAILWAERGRIGYFALLITSVAFVFNGDFTWIALLNLLPRWHLVHMRYFDPLAFPVPLSLLALGSFYLWVYARRAHKDLASNTARPAALPCTAD
jgi:hypothetical protein